jgi:hypothetical protein
MTYKSDDVLGRRRLYKSIIDNKNNFPAPGLPDIFKLMSKYFQGLCLNLTVEKEDGTVIDFDKYSSTTDKSPLSVNEQQVSATDSSRYNEEEGTK